jgi:hypothetical protein
MNMQDVSKAPRVVVVCPAEHCSFNVKNFCSGMPWIDMGISNRTHTVRCMDYVDERQLQDAKELDIN